MNARQSAWTLAEFAILIASPSVDSKVLSETDLDSRSPGAIDVVRQGVHLYLSGEDSHGILSELMTKFLEPRRGHVLCAACQTVH